MHLRCLKTMQVTRVSWQRHTFYPSVSLTERRASKGSGKNNVSPRLLWPWAAQQCKNSGSTPKRTLAELPGPDCSATCLAQQSNRLCTHLTVLSSCEHSLTMTVMSRIILNSGKPQHTNLSYHYSRSSNDSSPEVSLRWFLCSVHSDCSPALLVFRHSAASMSHMGTDLHKSWHDKGFFTAHSVHRANFMGISQWPHPTLPIGQGALAALSLTADWCQNTFAFLTGAFT